MDLRSALSKVNKRGILLIFPINDRKEPLSLWSEFFPKTEMRWEWDESGDNRVGELWHIRERLSSSGKVVYTKWFRGRATVMSMNVAAALIRVLGTARVRQEGEGLTFAARELLDLLNEDSPLSTKQLKKMSGLSGRENEKVYVAAMKELWSRLWIVGFGEVDEGAFPSLAVGSTRVLFEELWTAGHDLALDAAWETLDAAMPKGSAFRKFLDETLKKTNQDVGLSD